MMRTRTRYGDTTPQQRTDALAGYQAASEDASRGARVSVGALQVAGCSREYILGYQMYFADHPVAAR